MLFCARATAKDSQRDFVDHCVDNLEADLDPHSDTGKLESPENPRCHLDPWLGVRFVQSVSHGRGFGEKLHAKGDKMATVDGYSHVW